MIDSIPERWKFIIKENYENATNLFIHEVHHLIISIKVLVFNWLFFVIHKEVSNFYG